MKIIIFIIINLYRNYVFAIIYPLPTTTNRLIGKNIEFITPKNNTHSLEYFAETFQVGLRNILAANPDIDIYLPDSEKQLIIPQQLILPDTPHSGIVINNAEMRLYYYSQNEKNVIVLPIAIGTPDNETPSNWITSIKHKKNPIWIPTNNMRNEYIKRGEILPTIFPAGPNNPMGLYALYLGKNYAIHGTNSNFGIGLRVTRGCVRLRAKDIEYLYTHVPVVTKVQFINEPVKYTVESNGMQYLEIHNTLSNNKLTIIELKKYICSISNPSTVDFEIVNKALKEKSGIPENITITNKKYRKN